MDKDFQIVLRRYNQYLRLEKSFSPNTISAYNSDLEKYISFLQGENKNYLTVKLEDVHAFSSVLIDMGIGATSLSRILSGVRSFYRFLLLSDIIDVDPTELLEYPKKARKLPDVLSVEEVDAIEASLRGSATKPS